jgi:hypothetical protein
VLDAHRAARGGTDSPWSAAASVVRALNLDPPIGRDVVRR